MNLPKAINQAEIDAITADYERKIAADPSLEVYYRTQCETEVVQAIGRQRAEALAAGGPLAEQIKAENEELRRQAEALRAQIPDEAYEQAAKMVREREAAFAAEQNTAADVPQSAPTKNRFCTYCGAKLPENANFCTSCGAKVG